MITRLIHPLWLREKISFRLLKYFHPDLPERDIALTFAPGARMNVSGSDIGHQSIALNGFYERRLSGRMARLARRGGMLVDAGANYGYYSLLWLANHPQNRCVAFEASPANTAPLAENLTRNNFAERCRLETCALSDRTGTVAFSLENAGGQTGWGGIAPQGTAGTIEVRALPLDAYWAEHFPSTDIDVLKIDVEGADTLVLEGARNLLEARRIRHIFFETNHERMQRLGISEHRAPALLKALGYRLQHIDTHELYAFL